MPLHLRRRADHYPDEFAARRLMGDGYLLLCGNLVAGHIEPILSGLSAGAWQWGASLADGFSAGGIVSSPDEGRGRAAEAFRILLARADLTERPKAVAGPPVHAIRQRRARQGSSPGGPDGDDPHGDRDHPVGIHHLRRFTVHSGELPIGALEEIARAPNAGWWAWSLSGARSNPPDLILRGHAHTLDKARGAHAACWTSWLRWAGLEQKQPTRWQSGEAHANQSMPTPAAIAAKPIK